MPEAVAVAVIAVVVVRPGCTLESALAKVVGEVGKVRRELRFGA